MSSKQKVVVVGAGPVGSLAALYAAQRGHDVEIYELRSGKFWYHEKMGTWEDEKLI
jgi:kynurenine 3-monooxygenase